MDKECGDAVYHPRAYLSNGMPDAGFQIATIDRKFGDTDIALAELIPGIRCSREVFSEPGQSQALPFRSLKNPKTTILTANRCLTTDVLFLLKEHNLKEARAGPGSEVDWVAWSCVRMCLVSTNSVIPVGAGNTQFQISNI
jgi:hypothetical protein